MSLNGIDIASWQRGIDLTNLEYDFCIVKANEGIEGNYPTLHEQADAVLSAGKLLGLYHFARTGDPIQQAEVFVTQVQPYLGNAALFLDWENAPYDLTVLRQGPEWAQRWLDEVYRLTHVVPLIYTSKSVTNEYDWSFVHNDLWLAQYASENPVYGYQTKPWTSDTDAGAWGRNWKLHQYTGNGILQGYDGALDLDIFYGTKSDWRRMAAIDGKVVSIKPREEPMTLSLAEVATRLMEHLCTHDAHGYSQGSRWGDGTIENINIEGRNYQIAGGDRDCSSAIISAYQAAGLNVSASYTGDMKDGFLATGLFEWKPMSFIAQRGDIYLNIGTHTALCTSPNPDMLAEFSLSETGGITGKKGDQTGRESSIHGYYNDNWDGILHFKGGAASEGTSDPVSPPTAAAPPILYRVKTREDGWLPEVKDLEDYAGVPGHAIVGLAIRILSGWYQVCTQAHGWLEPVSAYNINDHNNGYAGWQDSPIIAVRVYYSTPNPAATGYFKARYRVSNIRANYFDWQYDNETWDGQDGYAGDMAPIDRFQISLVR